MRYTIFDTPVIISLLRWTTLFLMKLTGWKLAGEPPKYKKYVVVGSPHTSNWDFIIFLAVIFAFKMKVYWTGKKSLFRWPFGPVTKWFGGIPIDRSRSMNLVAQTIENFNKHEEFIMLFTPEGTRKKVDRWKTGFYYVALGAGIPIVLGFADYPSKVFGIGTIINPTGDIEQDFNVIRKFYSDKRGKYPEKTGDIVVMQK